MTSREARYFAADGTRVPKATTMGDAEFAKRFGDVPCMRCDGYSRIVGITADDQLVPVVRRVYYKTKGASLHKCGAKCRNARHNGACECSCGGANHGAG